MNIGLLLPKLSTRFGAAAAAAAPEDGDRDYVRQLAASYGLSPAQAQTLRLVLQAARDEELRILREADTGQLPAPLQARLLAARSRAEQRLRALLTPEQRERYDHDSRPHQELLNR